MYARSLALLISLALTACDGGAPAPSSPSGGDGAQASAEPAESPEDVLELGEPLARVGDVIVGSREFISVASRRAPEPGQETLSKETRLELLDDLIDQKALYLEARRMGMDRDPKIQRQMIQMYLRRHVYRQVRAGDFTDEDLRTFFEDHRDDFVIPEKVRVRRLFVKADPTRPADEARAIAEKARARIMADVDGFPLVAREVSEGPYRGRGGEIGLVSRNGRPGLPDDVVDAAFEMKVGSVSEVFEAGGGFNVIAVVSRRDRVERTFDQMKGAVLRRAKAERHKALYEETVERLRKDLDIEVYEDKVAEVGVFQPIQVDGLRGIRSGVGSPPALDPSTRDDGTDEDSSDDAEGAE